MLPEQFAIYSEGLAKEKAAQEASNQEAKEELIPTTQAASPASVLTTNPIEQIAWYRFLGIRLFVRLDGFSSVSLGK